MSPVPALLLLLAAYATCGLAFAVPFAASWAGRIDPAARAAPAAFRAAIVPGAAAMWPVLLLKRVRAARTPGARA